MGCNCKKVTVGAAPQPRTFYVDQQRVREVTGMTMPAQGAAVGLAQGSGAGADLLDSAQARYVVPGLVLGAAGGMILAKTVLMAHPLLAGAVGLGGGVWYALSHLFDCGGFADPQAPSPTAVELASCSSQGANLGGVLGVGAGLLIEGAISRFQGQR